MTRDPEMERAVSEALDNAIARAYDFDGATTADIGLVLVQLTTRWARGALTPAQILEIVHAVLSEPAPTITVTEVNITGREPLPRWCRAVVTGSRKVIAIPEELPEEMIAELRRAHSAPEQKQLDHLLDSDPKL